MGFVKNIESNMAAWIKVADCPGLTRQQVDCLEMLIAKLERLDVLYHTMLVNGFWGC